MIVVNGRFLTQKMTGVQRYALEISLRLQKMLGDTMTVAVPESITEEQIDSRLNIVKVGTHSGHIWAQTDLPKWLKQQGSPLLLCFCGVAPIKYDNKIHTLHDITYVRYPKTFTWAFRTWYNFAMPRVLKTSKHIITVSEFSKDEIANHYGISKDNITVIPSAPFEMGEPIKDDELKRKNYILAVSTLKENKNFKVVLESFLKAKEKVEDLELVIVGDVRGLSAFKDIDGTVEKIKNCNHVNLVGRVSDEELVRYYTNATAFIFPSLYEGFGLPPLEAQMCGCPVISTNACSLPAVLGNSAILCNPRNRDEIAEAIIKISTNKQLADELKEKGYENYKRFSFDKSADMVMKLIEKYK